MSGIFRLSTGLQSLSSLLGRISRQVSHIVSGTPIDQLFFAPVIVEDETIGYISVLETPDQQETAERAAAELKRKAAKQAILAEAGAS